MGAGGGVSAFLESAPNRQGGRVRLLVVDDEEDIRTALVERLREEGYDVVEAADGPHAVAANGLGAEQIDVALVDVGLPGFDGFEVMERFRRQPVPPAVVFFTVHHRLDDRLHGLYQGAFAYITKPAPLEEIVATVGAAARHHRDLRRAFLAETSDPLTGLGNLRLFEMTARDEAARAARYRRPLALLLLALDGLAEVNRLGGLAAGDEALRALGRILERTCRETDRPFRVGGDRFAVLLPETDREGAGIFVVRLKDALRADAAERAGSVPRPSAVRAAIAILPVDGRDAASLYRSADRSLWRGRGETPAPPSTKG